jgi:hypothetical protein
MSTLLKKALERIRAFRWTVCLDPAENDAAVPAFLR